MRKRINPPHRQSVAEISAEQGIYVVVRCEWRKAKRLRGQVVPASYSQKDPEGLGPTDKFTVMLETIGLNATELGRYCRERGPFPEQGGPLAPGSPGCQCPAATANESDEPTAEQAEMNKRAEVVAAKAKAAREKAIEAAEEADVEPPDLEPLAEEAMPRRGLTSKANGTPRPKPSGISPTPIVI